MPEQAQVQEDTQQEPSNVYDFKDDQEIEEFVNAEQEVDDSFLDDDDSFLDDDEPIDEMETDPNAEPEEPEEEENLDPDSIYDDVNEEELEEEENLDNVPEDEIYTAAMDVKSFADYRDAAIESGIELDPSFVTMLAKEGVDPSFLAEREVYDIKDFVDIIGQAEDRLDPEAVYVPEDLQSEEGKEFMAKHMNVPESPDDYSDDLFENTFLSESPEFRDNLKEFGARFGLNPDQLRAVADQYDFDRQEMINEKRETHQAVLEETKHEMETQFRDDAKYILSDIHKIMKSHGSEFYNKYKNSDALNDITSVSYTHLTLPTICSV